MARAGLEALRVGHLHVAQPFPGIGQRCRHVGLFDVHVECVADHEHRGAVDGVTKTHRIGDRHAHIVLIAIQRLDEHPRAGTLGALRKRPQSFEEERLVFLTGAAGRDAGKIPRASPDGHDDDARAELAREIEQRGDVGSRRSDLFRVRVDQPAAVPTRDRGHRDLLADRGSGFVEGRTLG